MTAVTTVTSEATETAGITGDDADLAARAVNAGGWGPPDGTSLRVPPALAVGREAIGQPGALEAAVIATAVEALWPRPVVVQPPTERHGAWRFSGRWWARSSTARRPRPWI